MIVEMHSRAQGIPFMFDAYVAEAHEFSEDMNHMLDPKSFTQSIY